MKQAVAVLWHYLMQSWSPRFATRTALLAWQEQQVQRHLRYVMQRSPFYAELYQGRDLRDWKNFPVIGKAEMMAHFDRINTVGLRLEQVRQLAEQSEADRNFKPTLGGVTVGLSSGTSGNRGVFVVSAHERYRWAAAMLHRLLPSPLGVPQRVAFFLRANSNLYGSVSSRRLRFEFFDLLIPLEQHYKRLQEFNPTLLVAPPSALKVLAQAQLALQPKRVVSVAEVLEPQDRQTIGALGPVFEVYQATEGFLGVSCPYGHIHLNEEWVAFQLEEVGQGRYMPVLTDFTRRSQPFLRYRLNDLWLPLTTPCACGSVRFALQRVEGRSDDVLDLPGPATRVRVFADFVRQALMRVEGLQEYQVRQLGPQQLELALWPNQANLRQQAAWQLEQMWQRLGVQDVLLSYTDYRFEPGGRKLRRVERVWKG